MDGYNIIHAFSELKSLSDRDMNAAREALIEILSNYQGFKQQTVICVFDAYKVKGSPGSVEKRRNIYVVYTKEAETADSYIEKATKEIAGEHRVYVATSDRLEQTGGIVQGMSGSPIIQDGKLVGAVTHVLVNDPTKGYGIFIENMLEAAE